MNLKITIKNLFIAIIITIVLIKIILLNLYINDKIEITNNFNNYKESFLKSEYIKNNYTKKEYIDVSKIISNSKKELTNSIFDKNDIYLYDEKFIIINYENTNSKYIINNQKENENIINLTFYNKDYSEKKSIFIYKYDNIYDSNNNLLIKYIKDIQIQFLPISIYTETIELKTFIINDSMLNNHIYINIISILLFIIIYIFIYKYIKEKRIYIMLLYIYIFNFIDILYFIANLNSMFNDFFILIFFVINYSLILYLTKRKTYRILFFIIICFLCYQSINYKKVFYFEEKNDFFINKLIKDSSYKKIDYKKECLIINYKKICLFENEKSINEEKNNEDEVIYIKKEDLIEKRYIFIIEQNVYENYKSKENIYILKNLKINNINLLYNTNYKNKKLTEQFQIY